MLDRKEHATNGKRHHRHHHVDESEIFKNKNLQAKRRRDLFGRVLFILLSIIAIFIMVAVVWMYTVE